MRYAYVLLILAGCATPPGVHEFEKKWTVNASRDKVWQGVIEIAAENDWSIDNMEKDSGLITTEWTGIPQADAKAFADFGDPGLNTVIRSEARLNVFVRTDGRGTSITVNTRFRQLRQYDQKQFYQGGNSRGELERRVYGHVKKRVGE